LRTRTKLELRGIRGIRGITWTDGAGTLTRSLVVDEGS
jgi:hypothetical protein